MGREIKCIKKKREGADCGVRWTGRWLEGAIPVSLVIGVNPQ